jgi:hypothetical protein
MDDRSSYFDVSVLSFRASNSHGYDLPDTMAPSEGWELYGRLDPMKAWMPTLFKCIDCSPKYKSQKSNLW